MAPDARLRIIDKPWDGYAKPPDQGETQVAQGAETRARGGGRRQVLVARKGVDMRAVILAGGLGTRLRLYTTVSPKPLVPIGERPVLEHIIRSLARCGTNRINLCVNYLGDLASTWRRSTCRPSCGWPSTGRTSRSGPPGRCARCPTSRARSSS